MVIEVTPDVPDAAAGPRCASARPLPPVVVFALDPDGVCTLAEGPGIGLSQLTPGAVVGRSFRELYAAYPQVLANLDRVLGGERVRAVVGVAGRLIDTLLEPQFTAGGKVIGAIGTAVDVTDTRAHEARLAAVARRDRALAEISALLAGEAGDLGGVLDDVARLLAELLGDAVVIWRLTATGDLVVGARGHDCADRQPLLDRRLSGLDPATRRRIAQRAVEGHVAVAREVDGALPPMADEPGAVGVGQAETAHIPVRARGSTLGVLSVYREAGRDRFVVEDIGLLEDVAARVGMAMANAALLDQLTQANAELLALLARQVALVETERSRIAADLHDDSIQVLAAVDLRLAVLQRRLADTEPEALRVLEQLHADIQTAITRLRGLLFDLDTPVRDRSLAAALEDLAARTFADCEITWSIRDGARPDLPEQTRAVAYRICQEALANVRRHSAARSVVVRLADDGDGLSVTVLDDGRGMTAEAPAERGGHLGLIGMRERAQAAGGRWALDSPPGHGTRVSVWLPVEPAAVCSA